MKQKNSAWGLLKRTMAQWIEDQPFQLAAALSYYTIFSLAPLLIIVIAIAGFAFGEQAAEQQIVGKILPQRRRKSVRLFRAGIFVPNRANYAGESQMTVKRR